MRRDIAIYNRIFPYYVEVCAVTQSHQKGTKPGGWGGHATLFMNGAEIDPTVGYPRLRLVAEGTDTSNADSGVGISVNKIFENVNWVAVPGREMFFRGGLAPDRTLDQGAYDAAVRAASAAGWFDGITIAPMLVRKRPASMHLQEFIVRHSIGTDFAMNFARTAYTARLPLSRDALGKVVGYLNEVNDSAQRRGYRWNAYTNNCSHVIHNALASAGVWDPKAVRGPGLIDVAKDVASVVRALALRRMTDFSFPANNFVRVYEAGNARPIDDARVAFTDHDVARTMIDGWISTGPGALITTFPMHDASRNELFATGRDPFLFSVPVFWNKSVEFTTLTRNADARLRDLGANLEWYRDRYAKTLASRHAADDGRPAHRDRSPSALEIFSDRFYEYITRELRVTEGRSAEYHRLAAGSPS